MSDPTIFDLSVREQLDAVAMTRAYLDAVEWKNRDFRPVIQPEVTPATDSLLLSHDVILYHCGAPEQPDWNLKAWIWQYTLSLTVLGRDPERVARICGWLHRCISAWPYQPGTMYGNRAHSGQPRFRVPVFRRHDQFQKHRRVDFHETYTGRVPTRLTLSEKPSITQSDPARLHGCGVFHI